jgi:hypothetical protein
MWTTIFTLMFWFGAGMMAGGAMLVTLALIGAVVAGAFGWQVSPWE